MSSSNNTKTNRVILLVDDGRVSSGVLEIAKVVVGPGNVNVTTPQDICDDEPCQGGGPGDYDDSSKGNAELRFAKKQNNHNQLHRTKLKSTFKPPKQQNKFRIAPRRG